MVMTPLRICAAYALLAATWLLLAVRRVRTQAGGAPEAVPDAPPPVEVGARELLDRITDGIVAWDAEWRYTLVNASAGTMLGHRPEELIGRSYHELFPEAVGTPFEQAYARAMRDQVPLVIEDYYAPWDRWFENRIYPHDGGLVILFLETTDRKRAEAEIARARDRLALLHRLDRAMLGDQPFQAVAATALAGLAELLPIDGAAVIGIADGDRPNPLAAAHGSLSVDGSRTDASALVAVGETVSVDVDGDDDVTDLEVALRAHGALAFRRVALRSTSGRLVGSLNLVAGRAAVFSPEVMGVAAEVAAQLEIALRQARSTHQLRIRESRLAGLHAMDVAILAASSVLEIADVAAHHLQSMLKVDRVTVARVEPDRAELSVIGVAGLDPIPALPVTIPLPADVDPASLMDPRVQLHPDLAAAAASDAGVRGLVAQGFVSSAHVPMELEARVVGHLGIHSRTDRTFSAEEVEVMVEISRQLAIALREVELREELERRSKRLAALHEMDLAILGANDPAEVARIALEHLGRLVPRQRASVVLFDAVGRGRVLAVNDSTDRATRAAPFSLPLTAFAPLPERLAGATGAVMIDLDVDALGEVYRDIRGLDIRRILATPLRAGGELYGSLNLGSSDPDALDDHVRQVAGEVAAQLAVALRQAQYRDDLAKRARRLELVRDLDRSILDAADTADVLQAAGHGLRSIGGSDLVFVAEYDVEAGTGVARLVDGVVPGAVRTGDRYPLARVVSSAFIASPRPIDVPDLVAARHELPFMAALAANGIRSLCVRPLVAAGELVGILGLGWTRPNAITDATIDAASEVADSLAVAIRQARLREALVEREAHLRTILDGSPNPILTVDRGGRITFANPAAGRAFGADGALVGMHIDDLVPHDSREGHQAGFARFLEAGSAGNATHRLGVDARRLDGSTFPVALDLASVEGASGAEVVVTLVDLSDRVALERQLAQAQRMETLGEFAGILAHDVRNYINAIGWSAGALATGLAPDDPRRPDVDLIERAVHEARDMVASVLEFARPVSRQGHTDVSSHLARIGGILARLVGPAITLTTEIPDSLPEVAIAPASLTQVLVNLATNARDAMPDGGSLRIAAQEFRRGADNGGEGRPVIPGHYVRIDVADTGMGMDDHTTQHAFDAFYTTKDDAGPGGAVGLGLASAYLVVARAGGSIEVRSEPGSGTTFSIELPVSVTE